VDHWQKLDEESLVEEVESLINLGRSEHFGHLSRLETSKLKNEVRGGKMGAARCQLTCLWGKVQPDLSPSIFSVFSLSELQSGQ